MTNFEIQKYYQNQSRFNGVYCWDNLPKIKNEAYVINLDEYSDIGTQWVALYVQNNNNVTYFDSFGVEHIPKEIKAFIIINSNNNTTNNNNNNNNDNNNNNKDIATNIFRIQAYDSIMYGYFCIGFIYFMLAGKTLTKYTNLFSPNNFKKVMI